MHGILQWQVADKKKISVNKLLVNVINATEWVGKIRRVDEGQGIWAHSLHLV